MTVALVANIARPISSAISTAFSADSYGALSSYGLIGGSTNPDAVIEELFAAGEQGAWYDPSDLSTMFQDSAGTTPVTADGQPVGLILDKSGRGNHASQAIAAARPLYKTAGGLHWLQFDGVDDGLRTGAVNLSSTNKLSIFGGLHKASDAARGIFIEVADNYAQAGSFGQEHSDGGATWKFTAPQGSLVYNVAAPTTKVTTQLMDNAAASNSIIARANGVQVAQGFVGPGYNFANRAIGIGTRYNGTVPLNGRIYSLILLGRLATPQEINDTEAWVANKTGVTL